MMLNDDFNIYFRSSRTLSALLLYYRNLSIKYSIPVFMILTKIRCHQMFSIFSVSMCCYDVGLLQIIPTTARMKLKYSKHSELIVKDSAVWLSITCIKAGVLSVCWSGAYRLTTQRCGCCCPSFWESYFGIHHPTESLLTVMLLSGCYWPFPGKLCCWWVWWTHSSPCAEGLEVPHSKSFTHLCGSIRSEWDWS